MIFKSTLEWSLAQQEKLRKTSDVLRIAANTAHAEQVKRIFEDGKNSTGQSFKYKSEPYKKLRAKKGRETSKVNWRFTGDLQLDYSNGGQTKEISLDKRASFVKSKRSEDLVDVLDDRYSDIFSLSDSEKSLFKEIFNKEFNAL